MAAYEEDCGSISKHRAPFSGWLLTAASGLGEALAYAPHTFFSSYSAQQPVIGYSYANDCKYLRIHRTLLDALPRMTNKETSSCFQIVIRFLALILNLK
jgi:hypothetical protein